MKKLVSIILSAVMALSAFNFVYADEAVDYTAVLEGVKSVFDIPKYDNFSYNVLNENEYFDFNWSNENDGNTLEIRADKDMNIIYYNQYKENENQEVTLDYAKAQAVADDFLKKTTGDSYSYYKPEYDKTEKYAKNAVFVYSAYINGYRVEKGDAQIDVSLTDGRVISYYSNFPCYNKDVSPEKPVSVETAKKALFSGDNLSFEYKNVWGGEERIAKPLYRFKNIYVNAYTGNLKGEDEDYTMTEETASADYDSGGGSGAVAKSSLTETEKMEIEKLENAVKPDEAIKMISDKFNVKISADKFKYSYSKSDNEEDGYDIYFDYFGDGDIFYNGMIKADKNFSYFSYSSPDIIISGYDNIKNYVKGIYSSADIPSDIKTNKLGYYDEEYYNYCFYGKYNGIKDTGSYVQLSFDANYNVDYIRYNYNDIKHTEFSRVLTDDEIFDIATETIKFEPVYCVDKDKNLKLYYAFETSFSIDAGTKEVLDYYGSKIENSFTGYSDVEGTWYEDIANTLINYGYKFNENIFKGDKTVTGEDIIQFFENTDVITYKKSYYYENSRHKEYADNPEKEVTKYEMAKIIVSELGLTELAEKAEFVRPFEDVNDENIANVAICKAYGIAKGNDGLFKGDKTITRAEMAAMVYNYILIR